MFASDSPVEGITTLMACRLSVVAYSAVRRMALAGSWLLSVNTEHTQPANTKLHTNSPT